MRHEYYPGLNVLRLIAAFGIVGCHINMRPMTPAGNAIVHYTDMCVCIFAMVSGFLLANSLPKVREVGLCSYMKAKASRLLIPYAFWTLFYLGIKIVLDLVTKGVFTPSMMQLTRWYWIVCWGTAAAHLWYLVSLFYATLFFALLTTLVPKIHSMLPAMLFIGCSFWVSRGWGGFYSWYPIRLMAFVCCGLLLYLHKDSLQKGRVWFWIGFFVASIVFHFFGRHVWITVKDALVAVPLILVFMRMPSAAHSSLQSVCDCSFGIYLVHVALAFGIGEVVRHFAPTPRTVFWVLGDWTLVFVISLIVVLCLRRVALFRKVC